MTSLLVSRRAFLARLTAAGAGALVFPSFAAAGRSFMQNDTRAADEKVFNRIYEQAMMQHADTLTMGNAVAAIGMLFAGTPYVAHSLELPGEERLVTNLQAFDCTTFVETTLALTRCVRWHDKSFDRFCEQLQLIRYRGGVIDGYPSRLHYFSDWLADNDAKGIVRPVTKDLGGTTLPKAINFMTTHPASYRQLADESNVAQIRAAEERLTAAGVTMIPLGQVEEAQKSLQSGDVIGTATSMKGIDVGHIGLIVDMGGTKKFLHAPLSGGRVQVTEEPFASYVRSIKSNIGIIVGRPLEPPERSEVGRH